MSAKITVPFHKAHITETEINLVSETIRSGWLTMGPKTIEFENKFSEYVTSPYAISMNSATACLHLALKAIGLKEGDEVIIPSMTFIATAEVVTYFKAIPILCDCKFDTHNIDETAIERLISSKTKAIIPVHFAGIPCDMDAILDIAKKHHLVVIEDAAHACPASYKHKPIGSIGDITCFSFYATKTLACGEGGMATTQNDEWAKHMKINRLHGISRDAWDRYTASGTWFYDIVDNGHKYNMTDIQAALGLAQLAKATWMRDERKKIADTYTKSLKDRGILPLYIPSNTESAYHLYVIKVKNRNELYSLLKEEGITPSVHFIPVHHHSFYKQKFSYNAANYPVSESAFEASLSLPIFPGMTDEQIDYVIKNVQKHAIPL